MKHILRCHDIVKTDFVRGENCTLYDAHGRAYTDLESGIWCTVLGHGHPRINARMKTQVEQIVHLGTRYTSHLAGEAAIQVLDIVGFDDGACTFLRSGSEAVEFDVQAALGVASVRACWRSHTAVPTCPTDTKGLSNE